MATIVKQMVAFGVALALLICLGVTAFAAEESPEDSYRKFPKAEVSTFWTKYPGSCQQSGYRQPQNRVPAVLPVILLGLAAGSTALLTAKERYRGEYQFLHHLRKNRCVSSSLSGVLL